MPRTKLLVELTRDEAGAQVPEATVIIPTAAIEQHGSHLPIVTDTEIVGEIVRRVADAASTPVLIAPTVCYGASQHHFPFPGVMSLGSPTFSAVVRDLLASLARWGGRRVYLLNAHGGNDELVRLIAREEARTLGLAIGAASYWTLAWEGMLETGAHKEVGPIPGHAGNFETSLMLALRPELVQLDQLPPRAEPPPVRSLPSGSSGVIALPARDELGTGMSDDGSRATAEWGERLLAVAAREVAATIDAFHEQTAALWS